MSGKSAGQVLRKQRSGTETTADRGWCVVVSIIYRATDSGLDLNGGKLRKWLMC